MSLRVAFCVSGRGSLFRAAVMRRDAVRIEPIMLILEEKAAADLDDFAAAHGVPSVRLDPRDRTRFEEELTGRLTADDPDLIALTFDRILPPRLVAGLPRRIINVHPALLPAFAGLRSLERTFRSGTLVGGATVHEVVEAVDAGPVIAQVAVSILPGDTLETYGARLYQRLEPMFLQVLRWYSDRRVNLNERSVTIGGGSYDSLPFVPALEEFEVENCGV